MCQTDPVSVQSIMRTVNICSFNIDSANKLQLNIDVVCSLR